MIEQETSNSVWLALNLFHFQGYELHGIFTTKEAAVAAIGRLPKCSREVREISLNTPMDEWMGA